MFYTHGDVKDLSFNKQDDKQNTTTILTKHNSLGV